NKIKIENMKKSFKDLKWYEIIMIIIMIVIAALAVVQAIVNPENSTNPLWLTIINFISAICGVLCVFFCAKANISNFVFATVNTIVYAIFLWYHRIFGTFALEVLFYLPINFISWYIWARHRDEKLLEKTKSKKLTVVQNILVTLAIVLGGIGYHAILVRVGGNVAWLDAFTLSIGIIAVILEMFRFKEQYVWWIITDIIAVAMYIVHFDPVYLTKKTIYLIMAVIGLINWHKLNKERNKTNE
ncbi:MAG: nicotinamide mononucleotide transporter, partial [Bacilli bacterium]|nr:nicotinamide mononucleotide transporter [Bacilli bacterium]